jgi:uncharacterized protein YktB (UPF0637 family)
MSQIYFSNKDFEVFTIDGLDARMEALTDVVRPKFHELGSHFESFFSAHLGEEFYYHVAKHARRTVNPPKDSWVAFAPYKRGYKSLPHFQIGLWDSHLFIAVAVIYEAKDKQLMAKNLLDHLNVFDKIDSSYSISGDHMSPVYETLTEDKDQQLTTLLTRLQNVKKGEFLIGRYLTVEEATALSKEQFFELATTTFETLLPIYQQMKQL